METTWESRAEDPNVEMGLTFFPVGDRVWGSGGLFGHLVVGLSRSGDSTIVINRRGEGPGEFDSDISWAIHLQLDSMLFVNARTASVFDSDMTFGRVFELPQSVVAGGGLYDEAEDQFIVYAAGSIYRLSRGGAVVSEFATGDVGGQFNPIALDPSSGDIVQLNNVASGFEVLRWKSDGSLLRRDLIEPEWWYVPEAEPDERDASAGGYPRPRSQANQIFFDDSRMWVLGVKSDSRWNEADGTDDSAIYDSFLLTADLESGRIVHTHVEDDLVLGRAKNGEFYSYRTTSGVHPQVAFMSFEAIGEFR
jgi:hypothetical protein